MEKLFGWLIGAIFVMVLITAFLPTILEIASWVAGIIMAFIVLMIILRLVRGRRSRNVHHHHYYN
jgi:ABC-type Fe3+-siderophore transport system permease subunit